MIINLKEIPDDGVKIEFDVKLPSDEFISEGLLKSKLFIRNLGGMIVINGDINASLLLNCNRCLNEFKDELNLSVNITCVQSEESTLDSRQLMNDELDVCFYTDDEIDMDVLASEFLINSLPMKILCKEECLGLCSVCGINLNEQTCLCSKETKVGSLGDLLKAAMN
ncbi:MAG: DUF177 domain-containing protein [Nitrospirae bacterium]|nr:DUF177 domain-containing protein [Nitrospirota bacterium]MBF0542471.1 DUF177 domain-containing protein [Nitrospirota bacterium]